MKWLLSLAAAVGFVLLWSAPAAAACDVTYRDPASGAGDCAAAPPVVASAVVAAAAVLVVVGATTLAVVTTGVAANVDLDTMRHAVDAALAVDAAAPHSVTPAADALRAKRPTHFPGPVWDRIVDGRAFNERRAVPYALLRGASEVYLANGKYVDSYLPNRLIVSRKHSQLARIEPESAVRHLTEIRTKYWPGLKIPETQGNVAKLGARGVNRRLRGLPALEIPAQQDPVPSWFLDKATSLGILVLEEGTRLNF